MIEQMETSEKCQFNQPNKSLDSIAIFFWTNNEKSNERLLSMQEEKSHNGLCYGKRLLHSSKYLLLKRESKNARDLGMDQGKSMNSPDICLYSLVQNKHALNKYAGIIDLNQLKLTQVCFYDDATVYSMMQTLLDKI